jgi:predicted XRE-type DNA-binding protein
MTDEPLEIIRGSGNVFADFGYANANAEQLKATLAAEIISVLDDKGFTVRKAEAITGIAAADFSRIRQAKLDRFTIDRLMTILNRLDQDIDIEISFRPHQKISDGVGLSI